MAAEDIRWLLALTAPRMIAGSASWYCRLELDDATIAAGERIMVKTLEGGKQRIRSELALAPGHCVRRTRWRARLGSATR
ncbi:MAG TPA: hypothetical protein VGF67_24125 [Ktedonobacteraceae bacterium]